MQTALLTTVNAPYQNYLDAEGLVHALKQGDIVSGQVSSFFTETSVTDQKTFAKEYNIPESILATTASAFSNWSGQKVALLA